MLDFWGAVVLSDFWEVFFDPMMQRIGKKSHAEVHLCGEHLGLAICLMGRGDG